MPLVTTKVLKLVFNTAGGKSFQMTLVNPKPELQLSEAMTVMQALITDNIFDTPSGELTGVRDIKVVDTITNDLYDPPEE